jgi:hypothetical protein
MKVRIGLPQRIGTSMNFKTIFDAAHQGYATWWFPAAGLVGVFVGALYVFKPALMLSMSRGAQFVSKPTMFRSLSDGSQGAANKIISWCLLIFALLWTLGTFVFTFAEYRYVVNALNEGRYAIVEGPVTGFVPMPYEGHSQESFVVGGHRFSYSENIITSGFHNTASHGGPIREGLYVRVSYLGNLILRLEVAE